MKINLQNTKSKQTYHFLKKWYVSASTLALLIIHSSLVTAQTFVEANSYTGFNNAFAGAREGSIAFSDVNSDGKPDVLITGFSNTAGRIAKLYTNSGTNFNEVLGTPFTAVEQSSIAFSDVNNDGKPDVLITGNNILNVNISKLYTNSGTNFSEVFSSTFTGVKNGSIAFSDVNNDGNTDVLITGFSSTAGRIAKLYTNSGTNFNEVFATPFTAVEESSIAFSDVNNDCKPDVLITGNNILNVNISKLYTNSGTNFSEVYSSTFTGVKNSSIAFSDVNNDGKPDVLITGNNIINVNISKLYTNSGTNFSEVLNTAFEGVLWCSNAFSDINMDSKPDVLITGYSANGPITKLYTNSGTNFSEVLGTPFINVQESSIAFSDVNSDGKPDVLITGQSSNIFSKLYLNFAPTQIVKQPTSATVCGGIMQSFTVSASGDNLSYLWSNNATTTNINTSVVGIYFVSVTGNGGVAVSNAVSLTVNTITQILTQPVSSTVCSGVVQSLGVSATGANLSYLWSTNATTTSINTSVAGIYKVTVSGTCGMVVSNQASLANYPQVAIISEPTNQIINKGSSAYFIVSATGSNLSYLWSNGVTTFGINTTVAGSYVVTVSGACGSAAFSNPATLKYNLSILGLDATKPYGSANPAFASTVLGLLNGDVVTVTAFCSATSLSGVGVYPIELTASGANINNYALIINNSALTITQKPANITAFPKTITQGNALPLFNGSVSGFLEEDAIVPSYSSIATSNSSAGEYAITATATGSNINNYSLLINNSTLTIIASPIIPSKPTITAINCDSPCLPGKTITALGSNLEGVNEVCFTTLAAKSCIAPTNVASGFVVVKVPSNAISGPVTFNSMEGNSDFNLDISSSVEEVPLFEKEELLTIYPNPNQGSFFIDSKSTSQTHAHIYNAQGIEILKVNVKQGINEIEPFFKKGIYLLKAGSFTKKVVVE